VFKKDDYDQYCPIGHFFFCSLSFSFPLVNLLLVIWDHFWKHVVSCRLFLLIIETMLLYIKDPLWMLGLAFTGSRSISPYKAYRKNWYSTNGNDKNISATQHLHSLTPPHVSRGSEGVVHLKCNNHFPSTNQRSEKKSTKKKELKKKWT